MASKLLRYLPAALWAAVLLLVGGQSNVPRVPAPLPIDKVAHFVAYGLLGVLVTLAWLRTRWPRLLWVLVLAGLVGVADELHQRRTPGRSAEVADLIADSAGILTAAVVLLRYNKLELRNVV